MDTKEAAASAIVRIVFASTETVSPINFFRPAPVRTKKPAKPVTAGLQTPNEGGLSVVKAAGKERGLLYTGHKTCRHNLRLNSRRSRCRREQHKNTPPQRNLLQPRSRDGIIIAKRHKQQRILTYLSPGISLSVLARAAATVSVLWRRRSGAWFKTACETRKKNKRRA